MKKLLLSFIMLTLLSLRTNAQVFDWVKKIGDSGNDYAAKIETDSAGNIYCVGSFIGQIIFANDTLMSYNISYSSLFLAKFDSIGNAIWGKRLPFSNPNGLTPIINRLNVNPKGYSFIAGFLNYNGNCYNYLTVVKPNGDLLWYNDSGNSLNVQDIDYDKANNSYITGVYSYNTISPYFVAKLDSNGIIQWQYYSPTSMENLATNIHYDSSKVFLTGQFKYQIQFSDAFGTTPISLASSGLNDWDFYLAIYSSDGHLLSAYKNAALGLLNNPNNGPLIFNSYFSKSGNWFVGSAPITAGTFYKLKKYSSPFSIILTDSIVGNFSYFEQESRIKSNELIKCHGFVSYGNMMDNNAEFYLLDNFSQIIKHCSFNLNLPYPTGLNMDLAIHNMNNIYITGGFAGTVQFDSQNILSSNQGSPDIFIAKLKSSTNTGFDGKTNNTENYFSIYPNPFSTTTILQANKIFKNAILTIYNSYGQKVKQIENIYAQTIILHRDNLPCGLYFLQLTQDNKAIITDKIVITDN